MCARKKMAGDFFRIAGPHGRNLRGLTSMRNAHIALSGEHGNARLGRPGLAPIEPQVFPLRVARHRIGNHPRSARMEPKRASSPVVRLRTVLAAMTGLPGRACGAGYRAQNCVMNGNPLAWQAEGAGRVIHDTGNAGIRYSAPTAWLPSRV